MERSLQRSTYRFPLILLFSIFVGSVAGLLLKDKASYVKPLGDIFLNLLFTAVVPLVFFSIASAIAHMPEPKRLGRIMGWMLVTFILTGVVASLFMIGMILLTDPVGGLQLPLQSYTPPESINIAEQLVKTITVQDFSELMLRKNMLPLILFAVIVGLAAAATKEKSKSFLACLQAADHVFQQVIAYIMWLAPLGLGAYFAYLVGVFGPELLGGYARVVGLYYPVAFAYFFIAFSFYAFLAGGWSGVRTFWRHIIPASVTALATGSSVATIPANIAAAKKCGVPDEVSEVVIPIGATIHMDGSCLSATLKMAVLFAIYHVEFATGPMVASMVGVALLSGMVMSGIPGGGFLGELMIINLFGFPIEALPIITMIGTLVDPPATMVNSIGDNVCSMLVARLTYGKRWHQHETETESDLSAM